MTFKHFDAPTIAERVALGREINRLEDGAIIPFPETWDQSMLMETFRKGGAGAIFALLKEGYEPGALHLYADEEGSWIYGILRMDHATQAKQILPIRATRVSGVYPNLEVKAIDAPRPLYGLDILASRPDAPVIIVEGEKAADAGRIHFPDHAVITWPGGAQGLGQVDLRPLAGRDVTIWPDNDTAGRDAAELLASLLVDIGVLKTRFVEVPSTFPPKWDVADPMPGSTMVDEGAELRRLLDDAVPLEEFVVGRRDKRPAPSSTLSQTAVSETAKQPANIADGVAAVAFLLEKRLLNLGEYVDWSRLGIAFKNSYGEEGYLPWLRFSEAADGFESEQACRRAWNGIKERNGGEAKLTIASYFKLAGDLGWTPPSRGAASGGSTEALGPPGKNEDPTAYTVALVEAAGDELWLDGESKPHVTYIETLSNGTQVTRHLPVTSSDYAEVLNTRFFEAAEGRRTLKPDQASGAAAILAMKAKRSGLTYPTFLRAGEHDGAIYVDLGDATGRAVAIRAEGWAVIADPPVRFVRGTRGSLPLPEPGGSLASFVRHFNLEPDDLKRAIGFMVGTFYTAGSYAILITDGEQGSCKSTMNDKVLGLTDPPHQPKSARMSFNPKEQDLHILAQGAHVLCFDNVSTLSPDAADVLCRVATGGASGSRKLYTNDGFTEFVVVRPVILTCIGVPSTRADLLDRSVRIVAQPVSSRRTEKAVQAEFVRDQPKLLGFLFSCVAAALANREKVEAAIEDGTLELPRMADFAAFVEGAHEMLGLELGGFSRLLTEGQVAMQIESARGDILGEALIANFSRPNASPINASARDILTLLKACLPDAKGLPATNVFSRRLKRIAVGLRSLGIEFTVDEATGHDNVAKYRIWTTETFQPQSCPPEGDIESGKDHF